MRYIIPGRRIPPASRTRSYTPQRGGLIVSGRAGQNWGAARSSRPFPVFPTVRYDTGLSSPRASPSSGSSPSSPSSTPRECHVICLDHLDEGRRSAGAGDLFAAAHRARVRHGHRGGVRHARHLPGRPDHRDVPRPAEGGPTDPGRADLAGRAGPDASGEHHQAAQHQRLDPPAAGRLHGAARPGLRHPHLHRGAQGRRRAGAAAPLRHGARVGGQPGAARGQFRPAPSRGGESVRPEATASHDEGLARLRFTDRSGPHARERFLRQ